MMERLCDVPGCAEPYLAKGKCNGHYKQWRAGRPPIIRRKFGLTRGDYDALLAAQGGGCAICGSEPATRALAVDHDHSCCRGPRTCGRCVRGLLCSFCNTALGKFSDSPARLRRAAQYLETRRVK